MQGTIPVAVVPACDIMWFVPNTCELSFVYMDGFVLRSAKGIIVTCDPYVGGFLHAGDAHINTWRIHCVEYRKTHGGPIEHMVLHPTEPNSGGSCPCQSTANSILQLDASARFCIFMRGAPAQYYSCQTYIQGETAPLPLDEMRQAQKPSGSCYVCRVIDTGATVTYHADPPGGGNGRLEQIQMTLEEIKHMMSKEAQSSD